MLGKLHLEGARRELCGEFRISPPDVNLANNGRGLDTAAAGKLRKPQQLHLHCGGHERRQGDRCQQQPGGWLLRCRRGNSTAGNIFVFSRG